MISVFLSQTAAWSAWRLLCLPPINMQGHRAKNFRGLYLIRAPCRVHCKQLCNFYQSFSQCTKPLCKCNVMHLRNCNESVCVGTPGSLRNAAWGFGKDSHRPSGCMWGAADALTLVASLPLTTDQNYWLEIIMESQKYSRFTKECIKIHVLSAKNTTVHRI